MRRGRELEPELKNELRLSIEMLGISQDELAGQVPQEAIVSQGFISNLLSDAKRVKDPKRTKALADTVRDITDSQLAAGKLSEQDSIVINNTWDRLRISFGLEIEGFFAQPGGVIPQTAKDYIRRSEHGLVFSLLSNPPFSILLDVPVQSGKSALLSVLETGANKAGIPTVVVDCGQSIFRGKSTEKLYEQLTEQAIDQWKVGMPTRTIAGSTDFVKWIKDASKGSNGQSKQQSNRLLIIDGIDRLPYQSALDLSDALRGLKRDQALLKVNLCATLSLRNRAMLEFKEGALDGGMEAIEIKWFNVQEAVTMAAAMSLGISQEEVRQIWNWFGGQPYLTHLALSELRKGNATSVDEIKQNSLIGQPASYVAHLRAIRSLFAESASLLQEIAQKTSVQFSPLNSEVSFLDACGLIAPDKNVIAPLGKLVYRISSEFYTQLLDVFSEANS